jgi:hypothetical protein
MNHCLRRGVVVSGHLMHTGAESSAEQRGRVAVPHGRAAPSSSDYTHEPRTLPLWKLCY